MSAAEALRAARAAGISIAIDGDDLVLEAPAQPPPAVLGLLARNKATSSSFYVQPKTAGPPRARK